MSSSAIPCSPMFEYIYIHTEAPSSKQTRLRTQILCRSYVGKDYTILNHCVLTMLQSLKTDSVWVSSLAGLLEGKKLHLSKKIIFLIKLLSRVKPFPHMPFVHRCPCFLFVLLLRLILICPFPLIIYDIEKSSKNKDFIIRLIITLMRSLFIWGGVIGCVN